MRFLIVEMLQGALNAAFVLHFTVYGASGVPKVYYFTMSRAPGVPKLSCFTVSGALGLNKCCIVRCLGHLVCPKCGILRCLGRPGFAEKSKSELLGVPPKCTVSAPRAEANLHFPKVNTHGMTHQPGHRSLVKLDGPFRTCFTRGSANG